MSWMKKFLGQEQHIKVASFQVAITTEDYFHQPWTITWNATDGYTCKELQVISECSETFSLLCQIACREQLSKATRGHVPVLPVGMGWSMAHKPIRTQ